MTVTTSLQRQETSALFAGVLLLAIAFISWPLTAVDGRGKFEWLQRDSFDVIDDQITSVNGKNCRSKSRDQLVLRSDTVAQLPVYNTLLSRVWYRNRTTLIHLHNMALNRAFFFSYVLQRMNETSSFHVQPNWQYFYFSVAADIFANPGLINGSSIFFDNDCHYPNWYTTVSFNHTLPLFSAKAARWNDYRDMDNPIRETTGRSCQVVDAGAGRKTNYTHKAFKMNPWYDNWLPDLDGALDSLTKFTYYVGIKHSDEAGRFVSDAFQAFSFVGPSSPSADERDLRKLPVIFPPPYFDCGGSNKWVFSAVSPVVDFMPRYTNWTHLRRNRFVAAVVIDTDFNKIDFNSCGVSSGNPGPSYLSGIARCRKTTGCKHKMGYGFNRGGYVCVCKPGWSYPWWLDPPFQGESIEQATREEYYQGFKCTRTQHRQVLPKVGRLEGVDPQDLHKFMNLNDLYALGSTNVRPSADRNVSRRSAEGTVYHAAMTDTQSNNSVKEQDFGRIHDGNTKRQGATSRQSSEAGHHFHESPYPDAIAGHYVTMEDVSRDDYAEMNDVNVEIERLYEKDVKKHQKLRHAILAGSMPTNFTMAKEELLASIFRLRDRHVERFLSHRHKRSGSKRRKRASIYEPAAVERMRRLMRKKESVNAANCHRLPPHQLHLPGDVTYGVWKQFQVEGRTALRLAHFLSMYLQNVQPEENFGNLRGGGHLHIDQLFGEVIANVMGNFKIYSSGIYFDRNKFVNTDGSARQLFGPWAYRKGQGAFFAIDTAGLSKAYVDQTWFHKMKSRFGTNFKGTQLFKIRSFIRSDPKGTSNIKHEYFPMFYRAPSYQAGTWSHPYFRCDGNVNAWVMTYTAPFFGLDPIRSKLEFKGVVTVDVPLNLLEIHQCPQPYRVANAFKNTARCDYFSTNCKPQAGFSFTVGSYRCLCRLGFEYWHNDGKFWMEGALMESEYGKKQLGLFSRFDLLRCRVSSAPVTHPDALLMTLLWLFLVLSTKQPFRCVG